MAVRLGKGLRIAAVGVGLLVGRTTLEPLMPFGDLSQDDLDAILSFLRAQPAVRNRVPDNSWTLMGKVVRSFAPTFKARTEVHPPAVAPAQAVTKERGEYLARYVTNCVGCHTPGAVYEYLHSLAPEDGPTGDAAFKKAE